MYGRRPRRGFGRGMGGGYGQQDGSQRGMKAGGRRRNQTNECRHPNIRKNRRQQDAI